jgi:hypothetical protein
MNHVQRQGIPSLWSVQRVYPSCKLFSEEYTLFSSIHCFYFIFRVIFNWAGRLAIPLVAAVEDMCAASCWIRLEAVELIVSLNSRVDEEGTRRASIASVQGCF